MQSLFDIRSQIVVIAGAAGAFGSVIVTELLGRGCKLALLDNDRTKLEKLRKQLPAKLVHATVVDITDESKCNSAIDEVIGRWGQIDAMINCVGVFEILPADELPGNRFAHTINTNLNAAFYLSKITAKYMMPRRRGRIINIASVSDTIANPGYSAYAASKAGLTHLTRVLAHEWAEYAITVNAISPAICDTPLTHSFLETGDNREFALSRIPMKRMFEPRDILGTVVLLLSDGGSFITGQAIHIDGGRTIS